MEIEPLSALAHQLLFDAASLSKGLPIKGRDQKPAARALVARGMGTVNKSVTRLHANKVGRFIAASDWNARMRP